MSEKIRHPGESIAARTRREFVQLDALVSRLSETDWQPLVTRRETRAP